MRNVVAGVDFSTKAAFIVKRRPGEVATSRRIVLANYAAYAERDALAARELGGHLLEDPGFWDDVWLCGVEYPFTMTMGSVGMKTMLGAIMATIPANVHVMTLPARLWTPWFLREHRADPLPKVPRKSADRKPLIKARAIQMLGAEADGFEQDAYDAFGISIAVELINQEAATGPRVPGPSIKRAVA